MAIYTDDIKVQYTFSIDVEDVFKWTEYIKVPINLQSKGESSFVDVNDIFYSRVDANISDPILEQLKFKFTPGNEQIEYRVWFNSYSGSTKYLDFVIEDVDTDHKISVSFDISEKSVSQIILLRKNDSSYIIIDELDIVTNIKDFYKNNTETYTIEDDHVISYNLYTSKYPEINESDITDWDMLWFIPGRQLQSAELNDIQLLWKQYEEELGRTLFKDGDIVDGCTLAVDDFSGAVSITDGKMYLDGRVRNISGLTNTMTTELITMSAGSSENNTSYNVNNIVAMSDLMIADDESKHNIGIILNQYIESPEDDQSLLDPAEEHMNYGKSGAYSKFSDVIWTLDNSDAVTIFELKGRKLRRTINDYGVRMSKFMEFIASRSNEESGDYVINQSEYFVTNNTSSSSLPSVDTEAEKLYFPLDVANSPTFNFTTDKDFTLLLNGNRLEYLIPETIQINKSLDTNNINGEVHGYEPTEFIYQFNSSNPVKFADDFVIRREKTEDIVKGVGDGVDTIPDSANIVDVTLLSWFDGVDTIIFTEGIDFDKVGGTIDWSLAGAEPTIGETYQCQHTYTYTMEKSIRNVSKATELVTRDSGIYDLLSNRDIIRVIGVFPASIYDESGLDESRPYYNEDHYSLDNGQRGNVIENGRIYWDSTSDLDFPMVTTDQYYVIYEYWDHVYEGDYVTVDSYNNKSKIQDYTSEDLTTAFDLRTDTSAFPLSGSDMFIDYEMYMWRKAIVGINKNNYEFSVIYSDSKIQQEDLKSPYYDNKEFYPIAGLYIPPLTDDTSKVSILNMAISTYTMNRIHKMQQRCSNLEQYIQLSALEKNSTDYETDGLKKGLFTDDFSSIDKGDFDFKRGTDDTCEYSIDPFENKMILPFDVDPNSLFIDDSESTNLNKNYTSLLNGQGIKIQGNNKASDYVSVQPYEVAPLARNLPIKMYPASDVWIDTENVKSNKIQYKSVVEPGQELGVSWKQWKLVQEGVTQTSSTTEPSDDKEIYGSYTAKFQRTGSMIQTGPNAELTAQLGDKLKDLSLVTSMRQIPIRVTIEGLSPEEGYKAYFNDKEINVYTSTDLVEDIGYTNPPEAVRKFLKNEQEYINKISDDYVNCEFTDNGYILPGPNGKLSFMFIIPKELRNGIYNLELKSEERDVIVATGTFYGSGMKQQIGSEEMSVSVPTFEVGRTIQEETSLHYEGEPFPAPDPNIVLNIPEIDCFGSKSISNGIKLPLMPAISSRAYRMETRYGGFYNTPTGTNRVNIRGTAQITFRGQTDGAYWAYAEIDGVNHLLGGVNSGNNNPVRPTTMALNKSFSLSPGSHRIRIWGKCVSYDSQGMATFNIINPTIMNSGINQVTNSKSSLNYDCSYDCSVNKDHPGFKNVTISVKGDITSSPIITTKELTGSFIVSPKEINQNVTVSLSYNSMGGNAVKNGSLAVKKCTPVFLPPKKIVPPRIPPRPIPRPCDPLAQSFITNSDYENGCIVNKIGIFVKGVGTSPLIISIGELDDTGRPNTSLFIRDSIVEPTNVEISDDASKETICEFDPMYLDPKRNYFFQVFSEDKTWKIFYSELGKNDYKSGNIIMTQPNEGVMFDSPNKATWKANVKKDLTFNLYGLEFIPDVKQTLYFKTLNEVMGLFDTHIENIEPFGTKLQLFYSVDNRNNWAPTELSDITKLDKVYNVLDFKADFITKDKFLSPIINNEEASCRFIRYKSNGRYISRTIETLEPFNDVSILYVEKNNIATNVNTFISTDNGDTWIKLDMSKIHEVEEAGKFEKIFTWNSGLNLLNNIKMKLEISSSDEINTTEISKLRIFLTEK